MKPKTGVLTTVDTHEIRSVLFPDGVRFGTSTEIMPTDDRVFIAITFDFDDRAPLTFGLPPSNVRAFIAGLTAVLDNWEAEA